MTVEFSTDIKFMPARSTHSAPGAPCCWDQEASVPFTFRGHRLSSLYRSLNLNPIPFIFPKILKHLPLRLVVALSICRKMKAKKVAR